MPVAFGTTQVNFAQGPLGGVAIQTAVPAARFKRGTLFFDETAGAFYQNVRVGGAAAWVALGVGGVAFQYLVGPPATSAPYSLIQDAIDAAVADGASDAAPAYVPVLPGTYDESVTQAPGVYVVGLAGPAEAPILMPDTRVTVTGGLTVAFATPGSCGVEGLAFGGALAFGGTAKQRLTLRGASIMTAASPAIALTNAAADSELIIDLVDVTTTANGVGARAFASTGARSRVYASRCEFARGGNGVVATIGDDVDAFIDCYFGGGVEVTDSGYAFFQSCELYATDVPNVSAEGAPGDEALVFIEGGDVQQFGAEVLLAGSDNLYFVQGEFATYGPLTIAGSSAISPVRVARLYTRAVASGAGPHDLTQEVDALYVETPPGGAAVVLSDPTTVPDGTRQTVKSTTATGDISVTVGGGGTIDGADPAVIAAGSVGYAAATYEVADGAWHRVAGTGGGGGGGAEPVTLLNDTGADMPAGAAVYISGPGEIALSDASALATARFFGVTGAAIADGDEGPVVWSGVVEIPFASQHGGAWTFGDTFFVSNTVPGQITRVAPTTPTHYIIEIGQITTTPGGAAVPLYMIKTARIQIP